MYNLEYHIYTGREACWHIRFALTHLQRVHRPLQEHLMSSLHTSETSGISIHTGVHKSSTLVQAKSSGDGMSGSA